MVLVVRTLVLYALVIISLRIMGKRQIGEMQPSELVVAIMISDLAAVPMQAIDIPLITGVMPVLTLIVAEVCMSFFSLKSRVARRVLTGEPSVIIYDGHVNEGELERLRFNMNDLLEQLRINNCPDISEVDCAVLETNGKLSIIEKEKEQTKLQHLVLSDGRINYKEVKKLGKTEEWLEQELLKKGLAKKDVFFAIYDIKKGLIIQRKGTEDMGV